MLDFAWPEILVIGAVGLVAIGPKDLPKVMHALGRFVGKSRLFFQDISNKLDQLAFEAEVAEKAKKRHEETEKQEKTKEEEPKNDQA